MPMAMPMAMRIWKRPSLWTPHRTAQTMSPLAFGVATNDEFTPSSSFAVTIAITTAIAIAIAFACKARARATSIDDARATSIDVDRPYTAEDVAKHDNANDCWVIIDGKVYDLTSYVEEHPGGVSAIARRAGGDCTKGFRGPQHPSRVFDIVEDYRIGVLTRDENVRAS